MASIKLTKGATTREIELTDIEPTGKHIKIGDYYGELTTDARNTKGLPRLKFNKGGIVYYILEKQALPSGRRIYRHSSNQGCVIDYQQDGVDKKLFVLDAGYRGNYEKWYNGDSDCGIPHLGEQLIYVTGTYLTDAQLDAYNINDSRGGTSKENTDKLMAHSSPAASQCRNRIVTGIGALDLPTIRELLVIYMERENIDALDPTKTSNPTWALGVYNPNGDWLFGHSGYDGFRHTWSSSFSYRGSHMYACKAFEITRGLITSGNVRADFVYSMYVGSSCAILPVKSL